MEIWKDIKGYEGIYQASNLGNIKSLDRFVNNHLGGKAKIKGSIKKPRKGHNEYLMVTLYKNNKPKGFTVHQLVAMAFLDHTPNGRNIVVDHIDRDSQNNNVDNLRIITQRENSRRRKGVYSSDYRGVYWHKSSKRWNTSFTVNQKRVTVGYFENEEDAHIAVEEYLKKHNLK